MVGPHDCRAEAHRLGFSNCCVRPTSAIVRVWRQTPSTHEPGIVGFDSAYRAEFDLLTNRSAEVGDPLDAEPADGEAALRANALAGVGRWRALAAAPMADSAMREASETMAHTYESLFVRLHEPRA